MMAVLATFTKDPDAVLDYTIDWSDWLTGAEELTAAAFTVPTGITKDSEEKTTTTATVWLSGGTAGESYEITCHITTNNTKPREDDRTIKIKMKEK
jgi:hypothetical protein